MKRSQRGIFVFFFLCICACSVLAEDAAIIDALLDPLTDDLSALVGNICEDTAPGLFQTAMAGDVVGSAALDGDFPHGTVVLPSIGLSLGNGIATILNDDSYDWQFMTKLSSYIENQVGTNDIYKLSRSLFPYPAISAGIGFGITRDIEVLGNGMLFPQSLTNAIVNTVNADKVNKLDPEFSTGIIELKVRKVFFHDKGAFPAMSFALGGVYGYTKIGATVNLEDLLDSGINFGDIGTVNLSGPMAIDAKVYGVGMEFAVSKQFAVFVPFVRSGVWYRHSTVSTDFDFDATVTDSDGSELTTKKITVSPSATHDTVAGRIGTGLELRLKKVVFHLSTDLDLADLLIDFSSSEPAIEGVVLKAGMRIAF